MTPMHFSVDGPGLAARLRALWVEDQPNIALKILLEAGMPLPQALEFLVDGRWTLNEAAQPVVANEGSLPSVPATLERLGNQYTARWEQYENQLAAMANPRRSGLTGTGRRHLGGRSVARLSLAQEDLTGIKADLSARYDAIKALAHLAGVENRIPAVPTGAPDFLRLYAEDNHREQVELREIEEAIGVEPTFKSRREAFDDEPTPDPEVHVTILEYSRWCEHGFLSPAAVFYPCGYEQHRHFGPVLYRHLHPGEPEPADAKDWFSERGWATLSKNRVLHLHGYDVPLSDAQVRAILAWHEESEEPTFEYNGSQETVESFLQDVANDRDAAPGPTPLVPPPGGRSRGGWEK
jgi:hypothetical protein